ncbi:MAG: hypothetical protein P8010_00445 [Desulfosarcinaceae bacterium]
MATADYGGTLGVFPLNAKSAGALIEKADQALYQSKHEGENRTTIWSG